MALYKVMHKDLTKMQEKKTSGLCDLGLITSDRRLSAVGHKLLEISQSHDFKSDNLLGIPKDSMIYLGQLLKTCIIVNNQPVRPFLILLYALSKVEFLTLEEFTYLLPLCISESSTVSIVSQIPQIRSNEKTIDEVILECLMSFDNYSNALDYFVSNPVNLETILSVGMNRKSKAYDKAYFELYQALYSLYMEGNTDSALSVLSVSRKLSVGNWWRMLIFKTTNLQALKKDIRANLRNNPFSNSQSEEDFKKCFFKTMHLFKAKSTLHDYSDLNKRYLKTGDVVFFEDNIVQLDTIPKVFFVSRAEELFRDAFSPSDLLYKDCSLSEISEILKFDEHEILDGIKQKTGIEISNIEDAYSIIEEERYKRFNSLIDESFSTEQLISLLDLIDGRRDNEICAAITDNADVPTIFEYLVGIIWYKLSNRKGKILNYMHLSLDADLLPVTHAAGGEADIVYEYEQCPSYPNHSMLIEVTLSDKTNQRRMEMEPVSRHLGDQIIKSKNQNSYCIFVAPFLHPQVISDFRGRKNMIYYNPQDYNEYIQSMKIIPLSTEDLRKILQNHKKYPELYDRYENAFRDEQLLPLDWYNKLVKES